MGLRLHSSSDALDLDLTQRYLSPGPSQVSRPQPRAHYNGAYFHPDGSIALTRELADHKLPLLDLVLTANRQKRARRHRQTRRGQTPRSSRQWRTDEAAEGRTLASSGHRLPGEHRRTPSLEREDAFRDPRTTKGLLYPPEDAPDIAALYRMGLLYDDEHLRGSVFGLNVIDHYSEPEYTMRPAKRARKSKPQQIPYDDDVQLALDLSLAELGRDESFAQFLCSPDLDELPSSDEPDSSSTYSARLAPLQFVSELFGSPEYFSDNTPELTMDSASDSSFSFNYYSDEEITSVETRETLKKTTKHNGTTQKLDST
ncbi:hypothetical protein CSAL01_05204 [Colletotrichum salicis]|uniref:Uncharacterized protein n=1 Tax=Colletotrichum salicis TaxID=1209931 RepID=A0A135T5J6_9PEZI|nr:hypothetical protein CSAL01_05204 [Colletotrichum salicis]